MNDDTIIVPTANNHSPTTSEPGFIAAAAAGGTVYSVLTAAQGSRLVLCDMGDEHDYGFAFPASSLPAVIDMLQRALATLEGRE